ncbi:ferredoxin reductase [Actinocatenispora comari]|jgi:ferredoxin-NADP reductase|uniref:Oxidoreductase n=1 Tax=Actinocatenispora comari TaxID=2807577 RepID=A0A8J4ACM9_9ACTN|nr:ferredoxin reductase [Actinocatenispora comari]GIL27979.1 oxidoreductase [Actinocatenispora comari]
MERTALRRRLSWQLATVREVVVETDRTHSIGLDVPDWPGHLAGQHVDVRLTADDGYQAQRSYSIASAPSDGHLVLTVERLDDGEVSPYLVDELRVGDPIELRGPVGGYFVWRATDPGPALLVAGGSGIVPFRAVLREHGAAMSAAPLRLLYSARSYDEVIYRDELLRLAARDGIDVSITLTRAQPPGWHGYTGRVDTALLRQVSWPPQEQPAVYVCGPTGFVEATANALVGLGHDPGRIRTERFGGTS